MPSPAPHNEWELSTFQATAHCQLPNTTTSTNSGLAHAASDMVQKADVAAGVGAGADGRTCAASSMVERAGIATKVGEGADRFAQAGWEHRSRLPSLPKSVGAPDSSGANRSLYFALPTRR